MTIKQIRCLLVALCSLSVVAPAIAITASPTIQWVTVSANCPTTHVQGIKVTGSTSRCFRQTTVPTLIVPLAYNDDTGVIVTVSAACPDNLSGTLYVYLLTDAGTPQGYCTDAANTLGVYVNAILSYSRKPPDTTVGMMIVAAIFLFVIGYGWGWSRTPKLGRALE